VLHGGENKWKKMQSNKGIIRRYMVCQQCNKRWEGISPDCYIEAFSHAKATGHYVYGKTVFYTEFNTDAGNPRNDYPTKLSMS